MKQTTVMMTVAALLVGGGAAFSADSGPSAAPTQAELEAMGLDNPIAADPVSTAAPDTGRAVVVADVVLQEGDTPAGAGGSVVTLSTPFVDGNGLVGFRGDIVGDDLFIWYDTGLVWQNSDAVGVTLRGGEITMGVDNTGGFIYSPSTDGDDSVWTDDGLLAVENVQAPGQPAGVTSTFHSLPTMIPTGQAYWVAGLDTTGGTSTNERALYTSADGTPGTISIILKSGDMVDGLPISSGSSGITFGYDFSDDGTRHIHELVMDTGSTSNDAAIYLDGSLVARESFPSGDGDNWSNFDYMSINNNGDYMFTGDTDGPLTTDEFIAYNGTIIVREGDVIDGVLLTSDMSMRGVAINNLGQAAFVLSAFTTEYLFFSCDASDLANTIQLVLAVGDQVDVDGGGADATVTDFNTSMPGLSLADDGRIYVEVDLDYGSGDVEAVLGLDLPSCIPGIVLNEIRIDQPSTDNDEFFEIYGPPGASLDGLTYVVIGDGTGGSGTIEATIDLTGQIIPGGGFFVVAEGTFTLGTADFTTTLDFENSDNVTHLLVEGFTGAVNDDIDTNDDCFNDLTPWSGVSDGVALIEEPNPPSGTECEYATALGLPVVGPDGAFVPGLIGRDPDGTGNWVIGPYDPTGGGDTPGSSNNGTIPVELMGFTIE